MHSFTALTAIDRLKLKVKASKKKNWKKIIDLKKSIDSDIPAISGAEIMSMVADSCKNNATR